MVNPIALEQLRKYCAYQERCHKEVRSKLLSLKVYGDELEEVISCLISENFLNEERFARSYARGKFRMKQWGRIKIKQELKKRYISDYCIKKAMSEIDEKEYSATLQRLMEKFDEQHQTVDKRKHRQKKITSLQRKGFEISVILDLLQQQSE